MLFTLCLGSKLRMVNTKFPRPSKAHCPLSYDAENDDNILDNENLFMNSSSLSEPRFQIECSKKKSEDMFVFNKQVDFSIEPTIRIYEQENQNEFTIYPVIAKGKNYLFNQILILILILYRRK